MSMDTPATLRCLTARVEFPIDRMSGSLEA